MQSTGGPEPSDVALSGVLQDCVPQLLGWAPHLTFTGVSVRHSFHLFGNGKRSKADDLHLHVPLWLCMKLLYGGRAA